VALLEAVVLVLPIIDSCTLDWNLLIICVNLVCEDILKCCNLQVFSVTSNS